MPDTDPRPRVALNGKAIRLDQLAAEVGTELTASDTEVVVADEESVATTADLQAALDAHVPAADFGKTDEGKRLDDLADKAAAGTLTAAEMQECLALLLADR